MNASVNNRSLADNIAGWTFGLLVLTLGILNCILVHPVPGIVYIIISLIYFPPITLFMRRRFNFGIPLLIKFVLGFVLLWFTAGMSDLGEILGF
jgi:hypothetical protein